MGQDEVRNAIRAAFAGVRLGSGMSLRQCAVADDHGTVMTTSEFERLPESEVTDDWTRIPEAELRHAATAYLDAEGLRYYLPALMLLLLDHYNEEDERLLDGHLDETLIGTLMWIAPGKDQRVHSYGVLDTFSPEQRAAIAAYLEALPRFVDLRHEDPVLVRRSIRDYWARFLPAAGKPG